MNVSALWYYCSEVSFLSESHMQIHMYLPEHFEEVD
jgi:hypothetical protein